MRRVIGSTAWAEVPPRVRVLFLCERNTAWSILAEAILQHSGRGKFQAFSAGLLPAPMVDPLALDQLRHARLDATACFSKSFQDFRDPGALPLDLLITPLDLDAHGLATGWPGHPALLHWSMEDPARIADEAQRREALHRTFSALLSRVHLMLALPPDKVQHLIDAGRARSLTLAPAPLPGPALIGPRTYAHA